jgi:hypothetical protein
MAKPKKDKNPTWTYIKEFDTFEEGYKQLSTLIPNIRLYAVDSDTATLDEVVIALTKTLTESIPSPLNETYPNTFSFSINSREVGFLTDDFMAFGWRIFIGKDEDDLTYQFRVTFTTLSISKRKQIDRLLSNGWKERDLSEKQSRFWNEVPINYRTSYRDGYEVTSSTSTKSNVPKVLPKHETSVSPSFSKEMVEAKPSGEVVSPHSAVTTVSISNDGPQDAEPILEQDMLPMDEEPVETIIAKPTKPAIKVSEDYEDVPCSIQPGSTPAVFIINHRGRSMVININDHNDGVYLDRSSYTFRIENVLYNYQKFQVRYLDKDYKPQQAQHASNLDSDKMRQYEPPSDEDFVGGKMVNEHAADVPEHIIVPPPKPKLSPFQQKKLDEQTLNTNIIPPSQDNTGGSLLKTGKAFVIDRTPVLNTPTDGVADQQVKIIDNQFGTNG